MPKENILSQHHTEPPNRKLGSQYLTILGKIQETCCF